EAMLPAFQRREDRQVLGLQRVRPGREDVGDRALVDEHRDLTLAHGELGVHLDLVLVTRETPYDRVPAVVGPLDDVDELATDLVHQSHGAALLRSGVGAHGTTRCLLDSPTLPYQRLRRVGNAGLRLRTLSHRRKDSTRYDPWEFVPSLLG